MVYAAQVHWSIAPAYLLTVPLLGGLSSAAQPQDQDSAEGHRQGDHGAGRLHHRIAAQYRAGEEPGPGAAGNRAPQRHHRRNSEAGAEEGPLPAQPELHSGHLREFPADLDPVPDALPDLHAAHHGGPILLALHLFVLHLRTAAGTRQRGQHLSRDGSLAAELRDDSRDAAGAAARASRCRRRTRDPASSSDVGFQHQSAITPALQRHLVSGQRAARPSRSSGRRARARPRW